jgi:hypothetical protein
MDARVVSNLIQPGSSGSGVFNQQGELIGVVFAGASRDFSFGFIVPQEYVLDFVKTAHNLAWVAVGTPVDDNGVLGRVFNFEKCKDSILDTPKYAKIKKFCKSINDNMIWSK